MSQLIPMIRLVWKNSFNRIHLTSFQGRYHDPHFNDRFKEGKDMPKVTQLMSGRMENYKSHCDSTAGMHATTLKSEPELASKAHSLLS